MAPTKSYLGTLLAERRQAKQLTQDDMARALRMARSNYTHIESGRRKDVALTPDQAVIVCRVLDIEMLDLVLAIGFPVKLPAGVETEEELHLLQGFRRASHPLRRYMLAGLSR